MTSNICVNLTKIDNFVTSKYYPEDISKDNTAQKESVFRAILVRIFSAFSRMRENAGKMLTRINPNTDSFYAV